MTARLNRRLKTLDRDDIYFNSFCGRITSSNSYKLFFHRLKNKRNCQGKLILSGNCVWDSINVWEQSTLVPMSTVSLSSEMETYPCGIANYLSHN